DAAEIARPRTVVAVEPALGRSLAAIEGLVERGEINLFAEPTALETCACEGHDLRRDVGHPAAAEWRVDCGSWNFVPQRCHLFDRPARNEIEGALKRLLVIEQTDPERGQRENMGLIAHVGASHLKKLLEPYF